MSQRDLEMKSFGPFEIKSEDRGEVVAIVATLGVVDKDGDVIQPGAFPVGGAKVKLSGYNHDVITEGAAPVGKGIVYEENGKAIFKGNFFMSTERGREAFLTTKELGADGEWSFGFPKAVKAAQLTDEWKAKGAKRIIAGLMPIEASPVFVGAGWGTGTLSAKSAEPAEAQADGDPEPTPDEVAAATPIDRAIESIDKAMAIVAEIQASLEEPAAPAEDPEVAKAAEAEAQIKASRDAMMEELVASQRRLATMLRDNDSVQQVQRALRRNGHIA